MKLLRLELQHWCQHDDLAIDFPRDAIVRLDGPNNSGKTNLIRAIGRVLAQGRSHFGDASCIQHGAREARLVLTALTAEGTRFVISRVIRPQQTRTTLEFEGEILTGADAVQAQLQAWFGRPEMLLQLFIAPQGRIASLLKEEGPERLVKFIEICGFKGFLKKQEALNKFSKAYPTINDCGRLLADVREQLRLTEQQAAENAARANGLPERSALQREEEQLQQSKTLFEDHTKTIANRRERLTSAEAGSAKPLPDLEALQRKMIQSERSRQETKIRVQHQRARVTRAALEKATRELGAMPEVEPNFTALIQQTSQKFQGALEQKNRLAEAERDLARTRQELARLDGVILENRELIQGLPYGTAWHAQPQEVLTQIQAMVFEREAVLQNRQRIQAASDRLEAIAEPSAEILAACQASDAQLAELLELQQQTQKVLGQPEAPGTEPECPLCRQCWPKENIGQRLHELDQQVAKVRKALGQSAKANQAYRGWLAARAELPGHQAALRAEETRLAECESRIALRLQLAGLPATDLPRIGEIILNYQRVKLALTPPTEQADVLRTKASAESGRSAVRQTELLDAGRQIQESNHAMQDLLQRQSAAQERHARRARLQQQIEMLQQTLREQEEGLGEAPPDFSMDEDYPGVLTRLESDLTAAQEEFRKASQEWTARFEQQKELEALKGEIHSLGEQLAGLAWEEQKETKLAQLKQQLTIQQQLLLEGRVIQQQLATLLGQRAALEVQQARFEEQSRNLVDLQAVGGFLSYDNGPQKFLEDFFRDVLAQTNVLVGELGLPITLHMGPRLEITVRDRNSQESSSLALGGGYANLVGLAFRIALQKLVLPRVHVLILDEPSTHVDERNMELLTPFFERLKANLASYGIDQCLIIDHHPAWKNVSVGVVQLADFKGDPPAPHEAMTLNFPPAT